jgi:hypothetical protein
LVHPLYFWAFYVSSHLMVISTDIEILYSFLYRKYINHIHLLISLIIYLFSPLFLLCWGYIVAFTKVLAIYNIWIFLNPLFLHSWNSFNRKLFTCMCTQYLLYSPSDILSTHPTHSHWYQQSPARMCSTLLSPIL